MELLPNNFNPHTPRGVRLDGNKACDISLAISIHIPLAGYDMMRGERMRLYQDFNPHTPRGVRPDVGLEVKADMLFQSTYPSRGTTSLGIDEAGRI